MKKLCLLATFFAWISAGRIEAAPINVVVDLGQPQLIPNEFHGGTINNLNGTVLNGQTLSINLLFANQGWVATYSDFFHIALTLSTGFGATPGFLTGSGYALNSAGNPIGLPGTFGSAADNSGHMTAGLFPGNAAGNLFVFYGVHFDLTLPVNPNASITGANLNLYADSYSRALGIGTIPNDVPDATSTLALLMLAMAGLAMAPGTLRRLRKNPKA